MNIYYHEQEGLRPLGNGTYERVMRPAPFRKPRVVGDRVVRPVKGGRWSIRKLKNENLWRAWTKGRAAKWNRRFKTHKEAVIWAHFVAKTFKNHSSLEADAILTEVWAELRKYKEK